jgi:hypothetical protein
MYIWSESEDKDSNNIISLSQYTCYLQINYMFIIITDQQHVIYRSTICTDQFYVLILTIG